MLEMLLVVAAIAILAGIVILAINPAKQLGDTRNAQRRADVSTILNAVYQYSIDNGGVLPASITTTRTEICKTDGSSVPSGQSAHGWVWLNDCGNNFTTATATVAGRNYVIHCSDSGSESVELINSINGDSDSPVTADNFSAGHCSSHNGDGGYDVCLTAKAVGTAGNSITVTASGADTGHVDTSGSLSGGSGGGQASCSGLIDLSVLTNNEKYLTAIPRDPNGACNAQGACYTVFKSANGRVTVSAPNAEQGATISVTR